MIRRIISCILSQAINKFNMVSIASKIKYTYSYVISVILALHPMNFCVIIIYAYRSIL